MLSASGQLLQEALSYNVYVFGYVRNDRDRGDCLDSYAGYAGNEKVSFLKGLGEVNSFEQMEAVIAQRRREPQEKSYTCYLFDKGLDKILKKVGEECAETIIAAKNGSKEELICEINDVFYHMMVMMNECGVTLRDVCAEMDIRAEKIGNLKQFHDSDHNT